MKLLVIALACFASACLAQTGEDQQVSLDKCKEELNFDDTKEHPGDYRSDMEQKCLAACVYKRQGFVTEDCRINIAAFEAQSPGFTEAYQSKTDKCNELHQEPNCCDRIVALEACIRIPETP